MIGLNFDRFLKTLLGSRQVPERAIGRSEISEGIRAQAGIGRVESYHLIAFNCRAQISVAMLVRAEVEIGWEIVGANGERGAKVGGGFLHAVVLGQIVAQRIVRDVVVLGESDSALPERLRVMPVADLMVSQRTKSEQARNGWNGQPPPR